MQAEGAQPVDGLSRAELLTALEHEGCPLCWITRRASRRYLYHVLHEYVLDGGLRLKLHRALGFCREHAWELQEVEDEVWHDGMGTATLYEDLARAVAREIRATAEDTPQRGSRLPWRRRRRPLLGPPPGECPACASIRASEAYIIDVLARAVAENDEVRQKFANASGLCLSHFVRTVSAAPSEPARRWLAEVQATKLEQLADELEDYIRKHTVGHHDEQKGREQTSWIRVIEQFVGKPPG